MPPMAEIAVEAAAVARSRRRDSGMRTVMEILRLHEGGEDGGRLSQNADAPQGKLDRFAGATIHGGLTPASAAARWGLAATNKYLAQINKSQDGGKGRV